MNSHDTAPARRRFLGLLNGNTANVSGSYDLDAFTSGRSGSMGMVSKSCSGSDAHLDAATFLAGSNATCTATTHMGLGRRVTVDDGASVELDAPEVYLAPGFSVSNGGTLKVH